jgi:hypothetical protein
MLQSWELELHWASIASIEFLLYLCNNCCRRTRRSQNYHGFDHAIVGNILRGISSGNDSLDWVHPLPLLPLLQELLRLSLVISTTPMTSTLTLSGGMCWWNSLYMTSTLTLSGVMYCWPNSCTGDLHFWLITLHVLMNWLHTTVEGKANVNWVISPTSPCTFGMLKMSLNIKWKKHYLQIRSEIWSPKQTLRKKKKKKFEFKSNQSISKQGPICHK